MQKKDWIKVNESPRSTGLLDCIGLFALGKGWAVFACLLSRVNFVLTIQPTHFQLYQMSISITEISSTAVEQGVHLTHNASQRFESRFCSVMIEESSAMMFKGMAGSTLGIWVAHGEGTHQIH